MYSGGHTTIDLLFTNQTRAFGFDMWLFAGQTIGATISVYDGADWLLGSSTLPVAGGRGNFFGWRDDAGIARVRVTGGSNDATSVRLDDVSFGAGVLESPSTTTPEPATFALVGGGLALCGAAARRRRTRGGRAAA